MAFGPFDNPAKNMMYENAINSLYNGMPVMPWEREVLAMVPLPEDIVDPFAAQDADPLQIMGLAHKSLVTWIDEARKANYFTKRFTDLSKLVLKGVNTMGRGLMTLHNRGEDLSLAPMQIGDLISVGSYHLRKSYLGVIQTASSHPEISERLLINQLSWTNMLLRLYKTKDKLAKPIINKEGRRKNEELSGQDEPLDIRNAKNALNEEETSAEKSLSDGKDNNSSFFIQNSSFGEDSSFGEASSFDELDALFEPAALSAPRALSSFDKSGTERERLSPKLGASKDESGRLSPKEELSPGSGAQEINKEHVSPEKPAEENTQEKLSETKESEPAYEDSTKKEAPEIKTSGAETTGETSFEQENQLPDLREQFPKTADKTGSEIPDDEPPDITQQPAAGEVPGSGQPDPEISELPKCLQIIKDVCTRSDPSGDGSLTFTFDEIRFLALDPDFNRLDPKMAAELRRLLYQIDSG